MSQYTLRLLADGGRAVAEKSPSAALDPAGREAAAARLRHEAAVLAVADHPGVVSLEAIREGPPPGDVQLRTTLVPGRSLADVAGGELGVEGAAGVAIAVATTVADLHERGVVHGRLADPSHVLLPPAGPPVLCGFGQARLVAAPACPTDAAEDVAAIGALLLRLLGDAPAEGVDAATAGALSTLARRAVGAGSTRPTARSLAAGLRDAVPDTSLLLRPEPHGHADHATAADGAFVRRRRWPGGRPMEAGAAGRDGPWRGRTLVRAAASGVGGLAALVTGLLVLGAGGGDAGLPRPELAAAPESGSPAATMPAEHPAVVGAGGRRFRVGERGDIVLVVEQRCAPDPVAVVVEPRAGVVTAFERWAEPGEVLAGRIVGRAGPVTRAATTVGPDGCTAVELDHTDGGRSVVDLARPTANED